jgi:hypothetical protein
MPIKEDPKALWEILVPCQYNDGTPVTTKHHKEWDRKVMMVSGGLTIMKPVTGQWSFGDKVYRDRNIPVRIIGTDADISKIIGMTMMHYEQLAIIAYTISERAQVFKTPQGMGDNFVRKGSNGE